MAWERVILPVISVPSIEGACYNTTGIAFWLLVSLLSEKESIFSSTRDRAHAFEKETGLLQRRSAETT
jgi:hypothetical protein